MLADPLAAVPGAAGLAVFCGWLPERAFRCPWNPLVQCMHARLAAGCQACRAGARRPWVAPADGGCLYLAADALS